MEVKQQSVLQKLINTFQLNQQQIGFGSYAAELSFYIIWSIVPLALALANVVAVLPINQTEFIEFVEVILPNEVEPAIIPLLKSYLDQTSSGVFSMGLIIALWPASNIFNTLQRVFNTIYKVDVPPNPIMGRLFAYLITVVAVIGSIALSFVLVFGETVLNFLKETFNLTFAFLDYFVQQGTVIGFISVFVMLIFIYHVIPNVHWKLRYSLPGSIFSMLGFILVSQLFTIYLSLTNRLTGNGTMGVFLIFVIWLYLNSIILAIGGYLNVFVFDYIEKSNQIIYKGLEKAPRKVIQSDGYIDNLMHQAHFMDEIKKSKTHVELINHATKKQRGSIDK